MSDEPTVYLACQGGGRDGQQRWKASRLLSDEPTVYLAHGAPHGPGGRTLGARPDLQAARDPTVREVDEPTVYLAHKRDAQGDNALLEGHAPAAGSRGGPVTSRPQATDPTVYLAHLPGAPCDHAVLEPNGKTGLSAPTGRLVDRDKAPPLLVSYVYVKKFVEEQHRYRYRHWIMDSGAFTAWNSGKTISLDDYTRYCQERLAADPTLREVFALDVIGDWRATLRNVEAMWAAGVPAIPVYHRGEPEDVLRGYARDYPKIAVGGMAHLRGPEKQRYAEQCFARVWPKPVHGLGVGNKKLLLAVPWHSVDATNWEAGPCRFGSWQGYGKAGRGMSVRGSQHDLRVEIAHYAEMEALARHRWAREMAVVREQLRAAGWRGYA